MNRRRPNWLYRCANVFIGPLEYWLNLTCQSFIRLASEKYERDLTKAERFRQAIHRAMCAICRAQERRLGQIRAVVREISREPLDDANVQLSPEARERIRNALRGRGGDR